MFLKDMLSVLPIIRQWYDIKVRLLPSSVYLLIKMAAGLFKYVWLFSVHQALKG